MSHGFKPGEKLSHGIRRIEKKQVERIAQCLADDRSRRGNAIHQTRKHVKKARAFLRLVRDNLPGAEYHKENRNFRAIGRDISSWRDAEVVLKTANKLRRNRNNRRAENVLARLSYVLQKRHDELFRRAPAAREINSQLAAARGRIKAWSLGGLNWSDLICGGRRSYKRGRKAFQKAETTRTPECLHEWRKRVKDLRQQLRILQPSRTPSEKAYSREMRRLGDVLGDEHDLVMLRQAAATAKLGALQLKLLDAKVDSRRKKLRRAAFQLGHRLYARKPADFAGRIKHHGKRYCR